MVASAAAAESSGTNSPVSTPATSATSEDIDTMVAEGAKMGPLGEFSIKIIEFFPPSVQPQFLTIFLVNWVFR